MIYSLMSYIITIPESEEQEGAIRGMVEAIYQLDKSLVVRDALLVRSDNPAIQGILDWLLSRVPDGEDLDQLEGTVLRPESRLMDTSYQVSMTHAGIEDVEEENTAEPQRAQKGKKQSVTAECKSCHQVKKIKAKGLCGPCYERFGANYAPQRRQSKKMTTTEPEQAVEIEETPARVERIQAETATRTSKGAAWQRVQANIDRIVNRNNQAAG